MGVVSDGQWALVDAGVTVVCVLAILGTLCRLHRRFEREHKASMAEMERLMEGEDP